MPGPTRRELIAATGSAAVVATVLGPRGLVASGSTSASRNAVGATVKGASAPPESNMPKLTPLFQTRTRLKNGVSAMSRSSQLRTAHLVS